MPSSLLRIGLAWLALLCLSTAPAARAGERFPDRPIRLIVAFAPGTGSDTVARIAAAALTPVLGATIVVDNRSGAGGAIGTEQGARAPADGYTLTLATTSTLLIQPERMPGLRYSVRRSFVPVAGLARTSFLIVTANTPQAPHTVDELVRRLRAGGGSFGSAGVGTVTHLAAQTLVTRAGAKAVHVPYRGSVQALSDVASGQLLFACDSEAAALPLIRAGRLRALAVTAADRLAELPQVPTAREAGLSGFDLSAWWGIVAPAGTPPQVVAALSDAAMKALHAPQTQAELRSQLLEPMPLPAAAFGALLQAEAPMWADFVRRSGERRPP